MEVPSETSIFEDLKSILETVKPREPDLDRKLPWPPSEIQQFSTRIETGVDCDFVFQDSLLIGNL